MKKYFIDTEFIEFPNMIQLISIGIKCEDGRKYYAISSEYDYHTADSWVVDNVIRPIWDMFVPDKEQGLESIRNFHKFYGKSIRQIRSEILDFVGYPKYSSGKPEFWGYYCDYDWVVFCWIFGRMVDLPEGFPMYCNDLKQLMTMTGIEFKQSSEKHNALEDAEWVEEAYNKITLGIN